LLLIRILQKQSKSDVGATLLAIFVRSAGAMRCFPARFFHCFSSPHLELLHSRRTVRGRW